MSNLCLLEYNRILNTSFDVNKFNKLNTSVTKHCLKNKKLWKIEKLKKWEKKNNFFYTSWMKIISCVFYFSTNVGLCSGY